MNITIIKTTRLKDGAVWRQGTRLTVTEDELTRRTVPADIYQVDAAEDITPGHVRTSEIPNPPKRRKRRPRKAGNDA